MEQIKLNKENPKIEFRLNAEDSPVFHLNKLIKNETFTLGIQTAQKFYQTLSLEIQNFGSLFGDFTLEFHIEKINIDA